MKTNKKKFYIIYFIFQIIIFIITFITITYSTVIYAMLVMLQIAEIQKTTFNNRQLFVFTGMPLCLIFLLFSLGIILLSGIATMKRFNGKSLSKLQIASTKVFPFIVIPILILLIIFLI